MFVETLHENMAMVRKKKRKKRLTQIKLYEGEVYRKWPSLRPIRCHMVRNLFSCAICLSAVTQHIYRGTFDDHIKIFSCYSFFLFLLQNNDNILLNNKQQTFFVRGTQRTNWSCVSDSELQIHHNLKHKCETRNIEKKKKSSTSA